MIHDTKCLAGFIAGNLKIKPTCRIFCNVLENCWGRQFAAKEKEISAFAASHGWEVKIHEPAAFGIVADFRTRK